jgi:hypothetical protein
MYQAWRTGHLNMSRDENGQPLTIPPVAAAEDSSAAVAVQEHFFEVRIFLHFSFFPHLIVWVCLNCAFSAPTSGYDEVGEEMETQGERLIERMLRPRRSSSHRCTGWTASFLLISR